MDIQVAVQALTMHPPMTCTLDLTLCSSSGCIHTSSKSAPSTVESHSKLILSTWIETSDSTWTGCTFSTTW